jgi:hypothetical protein
LMGQRWESYPSVAYIYCSHRYLVSGYLLQGVVVRYIIGRGVVDV